MQLIILICVKMFYHFVYCLHVRNVEKLEPVTVAITVVVLSSGVPVVLHIFLCWPDIQCEMDSSN